MIYYELADLFGDDNLKTIAGKYVFGINHPIETFSIRTIIFIWISI